MEKNDQLWESVLHENERALLCDENTTPPSTGWVIAAQIMNAQDIATFIEVTAQSHNCNPSDISYFYEPVVGDDGRILLSELSLVFVMTSLTNGVLIDRQIHTIRVVVPQEVQQRARAMLESQTEAPKSRARKGRTTKKAAPSI
jgi:hypothetical protein